MCHKGHNAAMFSIGILLERGQNIQKDVTRANEYLHMAADGTPGHTMAQWELGLKYQTARNVELDGRKAAKYYRMCVEATRDRDAAFNLAVILKTGQVIHLHPC